MLKKVEKTAKSVNEAVELAAAELGVTPEEVSYTVTREIGKGLMKFLVGSEVDIVAWRTADENTEKITLFYYRFCAHCVILSKYSVC